MRGPSLSRVSIRDFTPRTYGGNDIEKKIVIRDKLRSKIGDLDSLRNVCRGKSISLEVCFYLYGKSLVESRAKKDLDNLLKILLDTLPDYMDRAKTVRGLGLIEEDNDYLVFEIHVIKKFVTKEADAGLDLEIFEWRAENM